jgi:hypothetical protein
VVMRRCVCGPSEKDYVKGGLSRLTDCSRRRKRRCIFSVQHYSTILQTIMWRAGRAIVIAIVHRMGSIHVLAKIPGSPSHARLTSTGVRYLH